MRQTEVVEFKLGPRVPCRIEADPPYTVSWYERDTIVEHTGDRVTITTKGKLHVKMLSKGYTRLGSQASEGEGSMWMTTGFKRDKPWSDEEVPVVGGVLNDLLAGKMKDETVVIKSMKASSLTTSHHPIDTPPTLCNVDNALPELPAPVLSIKNAIDDLGCFDFWMDDDKVKALVNDNAFGKALAPMNVSLGKESDGRWRLTRA